MLRNLIRRKGFCYESGISSGIAALGSTKFSSLTGERWTYTASGPVTNLASRLCSAAGERGILIDEETAKRSKEFIEMKELGKKQFKNVKTPIRVFTLAGKSA